MRRSAGCIGAGRGSGSGTTCSRRPVGVLCGKGRCRTLIGVMAYRQRLLNSPKVSPCAGHSSAPGARAVAQRDGWSCGVAILDDVVPPARKRKIRLVVALSAAVLLAGALVYTSLLS